AVQRERRLAGVLAVGLEGDLVAEADDVLQQAQHFLGFGAVIEGRNDLERPGDLFQIGFQLGLEIGVQHERRYLTCEFQVIKRPDDSRPGVRLEELKRSAGMQGRWAKILRSCRPDPATEPGSSRLLSTWPGRL